MDSPPGSPLLDDEDISVPCKGCGNVLEEGKAFELAGNRWHIDCFRCNSCGTLLDSDANLLLLGDGSLICNSCTYSCTACNNKIEDLAILTGDQAFCAGCFRCRNCKRKIENLKYARTSQGIFCMSCHETLMSRRKKRQKAASQKTPAPALSNVPSPMLALDKSLPSLPKDDDPPPPLPIQARPQTSRTSSSKSSAPDQLSPISYNHPTAGIGDNLRTPRTASNNRNSQASQLSLDMGQSMGNDYSFIPLVLDNSPGPSPVPLPNTAYNRSGVQNESYYRSERDYPRPSYDRKTSNASSHYEPERDRNARPHIATQDRSYDLQVGYDRNEPSRGSHDSERVSDKADSDSIYMKNEAQIARDYLRSQEVEKTLGPSINIENQPSHFKLHDVPRERKKSVGTLIKSLEVEEQREKSRSSSPVRGIANPPPRGDSFRPPTVRTESPVSGVSARIKAFETPIVTAPSPNNRSYAASGGSNSSSTTIESPETPITSKDSKYSTKSELTLSTFGSSPVQAPRPSPPRRPSTAQESTFSESYSEASPILPGYKSPIGGFGEEVSRAFDGAGGILGRFSGSVKHGRSLSEATKQSPKWPRSPSSGHYLPNFNDISGPMSPGGDDVVSLRQEVRRSNQRVAELEARLNASAAAKILEHNIQEKRNTVAMLETEREAFLRELMVIKERLDASKDGQSINPEELKSDLIRGLTRELEDLKTSLKYDIQELVKQRDELVEAVESYGRMREQAIQETEQLNMKNAQLADLNNELTRRIQGQFKANKHQVPGLGIYDGSQGDLLELKDPEKRPATATTTTTSLNTIGVPYSETSEGTEVFTAQKVEPFKNGAQQKKFFWKKPGQTLMKGAGKVGRVFGGENQGGTNGFENQSYKPPGAANKKQKTNRVQIFGGDLGARAAFEGSNIPIIIQKCIQEVEMRGMDYEGIYRKSGGSTQMRQIQEEFERGDDVQFTQDLDICTVTSVLKQYLRNLPNPLITYEVYDRFIETSHMIDEEPRCDTLKLIIEDLPPAHKDVLVFIIFHLARVAARRDENLMNTRNLAVVFAPTLIRHVSDEREMSDMHSRNNAVQFMIEHNEKIFLPGI